jgi:hypothetical protein
MPGSTLAFLKERLRQDLTGDVNFFKRLLSFFELRVPQEVAIFGVVSEFFFPLVIPPESYTLDEPFTLEITPTQGGGLVVEENGINQRMIKISGHTGWKPRKAKGSVSSLETLSPDERSYTRALPSFVLAEISGHRHFMYLQDAVFRTYADLKRDPALAPDTVLIFHNPKDDEHWVVAPQRFSLERSASQPTLYKYNIELLIVDRAEAVDINFSEDKSLLDSIKDAIRAVKRAVDMVTGAIQDITNLVNEVRTLIKNIESIIDNVRGIATAAQNFVDGVTALVATPYERLIETITATEDGLFLYENLLESGAEINEMPAKVLQDLQAVVDGLELMGTHPEVFETPSRVESQVNRDRQQFNTNTTAEERAAASAASAPTSFRQVNRLGTAITPGEVTRGQADSTVGQQVNQYTSSREYVIGQGDTLVNLASRFLGDARLWQDIAVLNGLQPPFVNEQASSGLDGGDEVALPYTVGIGRKLLIPSYSRPPQRFPLLPVLGVKPEEDSDRHLLGTDLLFEEDDQGFYDLAVDENRGAVDLRQAVGTANIIQVVQLRLITEKRTDPLYRAVGLRRIIALNVLPADIETARYYMVETLTADPRIAVARNLTLEQDETQADKLNVDAKLEIRGYSEGVTIQAKV